MRIRHPRARAARALRQGQRGMTLLEIMIVIAILGMLASVIVVAVMNQFENAKINTTRLKLGQIKQAVQQYYANVGEYPTQSQGLRALLNPPGGYKPMLENEPKDEWGNAILYFNPPRRGGGPFELVSKGIDGQEGTDDDISTGNMKK